MLPSNKTLSANIAITEPISRYRQKHRNLKFLPHCRRCARTFSIVIRKSITSLTSDAGVLTPISEWYFWYCRHTTSDEKTMDLKLLIVLSLFIAISRQFQYKHHNNDELLQVLENVRAKCPTITRIYTLSETSVLGVPLYVLEFSTKPGYHELSKFVTFIFQIV